MTRSYSHENASGMPGGLSKIDAKSREMRAEFKRASHGGAPPEQTLGSEMVRSDKPHPAPRPSPGMAYGGDAAAHQHRLEMDRERAAKADPGREMRKSQFMAARKGKSQERKPDRDR